MVNAKEQALYLLLKQSAECRIRFSLDCNTHAAAAAAAAADSLLFLCLESMLVKRHSNYPFLNTLQTSPCGSPHLPPEP
jgi:hypothetical protein